MQTPLGIGEIFGLSPFLKTAREALITFRGDAHTPPSRFDYTSLRILDPRLSLGLWLGRRPDDRLVPIYNFYSHVRPAPELGWSVRVTTARDFRGGQATYDSHNGTDFAIPPGTIVVAAAPGKVLRVSSEFNRGGLKIFIDHGRGLVTTSNHLGRALVKAGDLVGRGQPIALSGMSGIDGFLLFPLSTPHLHCNVWLDGDYVDPFARPGERSLWRSDDNHPVPARRPDGEGAQQPGEDFAPTAWDQDAVARAIEACRSEAVRAELRAIERDDERALSTLFQLNYFPTRFSERPRLYREAHPRAPHLDLPFRAEDYDGARYPTRGAP